MAYPQSYGVKEHARALKKLLRDVKGFEPGAATRHNGPRREEPAGQNGQPQGRPDDDVAGPGDRPEDGQITLTFSVTVRRDARPADAHA